MKISRFLFEELPVTEFFLVGAFSFNGKNPTITVTSFFRQKTEYMRSEHFLQNY